MVLALNDSHRIVKDFNFKALKVFSDFCIQQNVSLRLSYSQSSFRFFITTTGKSVFLAAVLMWILSCITCSGSALHGSNGHLISAFSSE